MKDEEIPERKEPEGGWKTPCIIADHKWALEIEEGKVELVCLDPHPESFAEECNDGGGLPVCLFPYWEREDLITVNAIPAKVTHVDDSTPSTPNGPAEYGFYIEIEGL